MTAPPDPRPWQQAIAERLPAALTLVSFDLAGFHGSARFIFRSACGTISAHAQSRDLRFRMVMYLVYPGPPLFSWTDPPDGHPVHVEIDAPPSVVVGEIVAAAVKLARTRCHAGAGHSPAIARGIYGELCAMCWASVRRILDLDTVPMPF